MGEGSPYIRALQKGLYESLEQAAKANPEAAELKEALRLTKLGMGAERFDALIQKSLAPYPQGGPGMSEALNVPRLIASVNKNRRELTSLLGEPAMEKVDAVLERARTVPPKMAWGLVNMTGQALISAGPAALGVLAGLSGGTAGAAAGGAAGLLGGLVGKELLQNWVSVTRTPESIKQLLNMTALGANALAAATRPYDP